MAGRSLFTNQRPVPSRHVATWQAELHSCGTNGTGQALMAASSKRSNSDGITYGVDGLAPLYINGSKVAT